MKRAELQAGQVYAVEQYGTRSPVVVLTTEPWSEGTSYMGRFGSAKTGKFRPANGGSGVAVAEQRGFGKEIRPAVYQLQQIKCTWDIELEGREATARHDAERKRKETTQADRIQALPADLRANAVLSRTGDYNRYYEPKLGRVEVNLEALTELVLAFHRVSYTLNEEAAIQAESDAKVLEAAIERGLISEADAIALQLELA